jgi:hypothetical protein
MELHTLVCCHQGAFNSLAVIDLVVKTAVEKWEETPSWSFDVDNCRPTELGVYPLVELKLFLSVSLYPKYSEVIWSEAMTYILIKEIL